MACAFQRLSPGSLKPRSLENHHTAFPASHLPTVRSTLKLYKPFYLYKILKDVHKMINFIFKFECILKLIVVLLIINLSAYQSASFPVLQFYKKRERRKGQQPL